MHFQLSTEKSLKIEFHVQKFNCKFFNFGTSVPRQNDSCRKGPLFIHLSLVDFYIPPQVYILPGFWSGQFLLWWSYLSIPTEVLISSHAEIWKIFSRFNWDTIGLYRRNLHSKANECMTKQKEKSGKRSSRIPCFKPTKRLA